ncbi:murein transglycosylase [Litorimonas cladophorae]|uniref:Murein transglycosylase n=1 Tax=Litorimonas cladophorae TaxID=1220491 RepID=A0A918NF25_9PROT|nr:lytic murein transglycosylase [Litorimonas cladophorae]GGX65699.1 murein transglycosylase [Litorimonas cladophorae]
MKNILLISTALFLASCANAPVADAEPVPTPEMAAETPASDPVKRRDPPAIELTQDQRYANWKTVFIERAIAKNYDPALVRSIILPAKINPLALERDANQPEFTKPVWSYVDNAASEARISSGQDKMTEADPVLDMIESRYRVPREVLTAIWGLESSYGRILGRHDIIDSLSTFAFEGRRQKFGETQLFAVLDLLASGDVQREQLVGAWAGAMGMTQFIPTTFRDYAVDFYSDGNKDLWTDPGDALGSAANYLSRMGWRTGEPVMTEVKLPANFDYSVTDGSKKTINEWTAIGVEPVSGQRWNASAGFLDAKLIAPGGARGPKFLTFKNFDVLRRYNNSTSYVMGISILADALERKPGIQQDWPRDDVAISFEDKKAMQQKLTDLGFSTGGVDGRIGPNSRRAIRAWQAANGLVADGYIEQRLFQRLMAQ